MDKETVVQLLEVVIGCIALAAIVLGIAKCTNERYKGIWNDGYCECGGHWIYEQAVGHRVTTTYIYRCDKCGKIIEVYYLAN